ncbi:MAG: acyltransferase family protein, partial [Alphaproteobacteria bacterium]|nr:acyltransferase family protein [Alphaproteobacteria bacterium]
MKTKRIGYIDAMRGFTMILVVYSHICSMCFGDAWMGWNDVFFLFRLPCFFLISGWLFEHVGRQWDTITIKQTIRHKFMVQIVPTVIFLLILAPPPIFFSRFGATKGGYWFTFLLFFFFVLHIF